MPFVEEKHLVNIHRHLEEKEISEERLASEVRKQRLLNKKYKRANIRMVWILAFLALFILYGGLVYWINPSVLLRESQLKAENKILLHQGQWVQLQENLEGKSEEVENLRTILKTLDYRGLDSQTIYTVQVAALVNDRVSLVSEELLNLKIYKDLPYNKYALGSFTKVEEAQQLQTALIKLGFKDAFVASYKNGKRLKIVDPDIHE